MIRIIVGVVLLLVTACGPQTPEIQTVVSQVIEAQTASVLSQVDWDQVMTSMHGKVGPNTRINAEGYLKHSAGFEVVVTGGELRFDTQASGVGGANNAAMMPAIMDVLTRWEQADSLRAADVRRLAGEIAEAVVARQQVTTRPENQ